jgi:hypothetical protein
MGRREDSSQPHQMMAWLRLDELRKLTPGDIIRANREAFLRVLGKRQRVRDVPLMPPHCCVG